MNLEKHISLLLFKHDCVLIPGFGAFVARKSNAEFNAETSSLLPPSKQLMFNPSLTNDDGLLVQKVSENENLSYNKAKEEVETIVRFWKNHLTSNSSLTLSGLGIINKGVDGLLSFEPHHSNFLLSSYGLEKIRPNRILMTEEHQGSSTIWWKAAAMVPLLIGGFLYFAKPQPVADFVNQQWSGFVSPIFNPEIKAVKVVESPVKEIKKETILITENVKTENTIYNHQVIAGSFKKMEEADRMVEILHQKGFEHARFTQKKGSFYYVALQTFQSAEEAQSYVNTVKEEVPQIWVLSLND